MVRNVGFMVGQRIKSDLSVWQEATARSSTTSGKYAGQRSRKSTAQQGTRSVQTRMDMQTRQEITIDPVYKARRFKTAFGVLKAYTRTQT
jgi:hypothetical protein